MHQSNLIQINRDDAVSLHCRRRLTFMYSHQISVLSFRMAFYVAETAQSLADLTAFIRYKSVNASGEMGRLNPRRLAGNASIQADRALHQIEIAVCHQAETALPFRYQHPMACIKCFGLWRATPPFGRRIHDAQTESVISPFDQLARCSHQSLDSSSCFICIENFSSVPVAFHAQVLLMTTPATRSELRVATDRPVGSPIS